MKFLGCPGVHDMAHMSRNQQLWSLAHFLVLTMAQGTCLQRKVGYSGQTWLWKISAIKRFWVESSQLWTKAGFRNHRKVTLLIIFHLPHAYPIQASCPCLVVTRISSLYIKEFFFLLMMSVCKMSALSSTFVKLLYQPWHCC